MSDRLFSLEQQIKRCKQHAQADFSEAASYEDDDNLQDNRFLALQQSLDLSKQLGYSLSEVELEPLNENRLSEANTNSHTFKGGSNKNVAVQMALDDEDKEKLVVYVKEIIGKKEIPELLMQDIENAAKICRDLEDAKTKINLSLRGYKKKQDSSNKKSIKAWVKYQNEEKNINEFTKGEVSMGEDIIANKSGNKTVLWTMSIGGCLGVAAYNRKKQQSFLAHWIPSQMTEKDLSKLVESLNTRLGLEETEVWLSTPSSEASYIKRVKEEIPKHGAKIKDIFTSDTLAINVTNGTVEHDFKTKELRGKGKAGTVG